MVANYAVIFKGLTKDFGSLRAVDNLSFEVAWGEFFGFLGPNGAGKTTTIKIACGLLQPTYGDVIVAGYNPKDAPLELKRHIGVLPEELNLYERLSGREFLEFTAMLYGLPEKEAKSRAEELLSLVDISEVDAEKLIVDYSGGMKKKIALSAALIHSPKVLFLDEPFTDIDAITSYAIKEVLNRLKLHGVTIFLSSHILEVVEKLCTQVAIINQGKLIGRGTIEQLRERSALGEDSSLEEVFLKLLERRPKKADLSWLS